MKTLILSIGLLLPFQALARDCNYFGIGVSLLNTQKTLNGVDLQGDYDGNGMADRAVFLRLTGKPEFAPDVRIVDLFGEKPAYPANGSVAIGIVLMGKEGSCEKYIVYDDFFFNPGETSLWGGQDSLPVDLIKKGSAGFRSWKKQAKHLKSDALQLGSESGIAILLYWNGSTFTAQWDKHATEP